MCRTAAVLIASLVGFFCVGLAAADSPFDFAGDYPSTRGPVVTFALDPQQDREVQRLRVFRPTVEQLAILRAAVPACGNLFRVVTPRYADCGCGLANIALWDRPGEVDIPLGYLRHRTRADEDALRYAAESGDSAAIRELADPWIAPALADTTVLYLRSSGPPRALYMDLTGDIYCGGERVDDDGIIEALARPAEASEGDRRRGDPPVIFLYLPPPRDPYDEALRLYDTLELAHLVASRGFKLLPGD